MNSANEKIFELLKALGREELSPEEFGAECREFTIDDVASGMNSFADVFGPGLPADAIEVGNLPIEIDESVSMFVVKQNSSTGDDHGKDFGSY